MALPWTSCDVTEKETKTSTDFCKGWHFNINEGTVRKKKGKLTVGAGTVFKCLKLISKLDF